MWNDCVLSLHIASAIVLMGGTVAARLSEGAVHAAADLSALRGALDVVGRTARFNPALAIVLLATGAALGRVWWDDAWFWVSVATWFANLLLAVRFVVPGQRSLQVAAGQVGNGAITAEVEALRRRLAPVLAHDVMIGLDIGTLLLMVFKPAIGTALLWPLAGVALSCALRFVQSAGHGAQANTATAAH